jgi:Holliday junction resolvase
MAKKSRRKGTRIERELVLLHKAAGIPASRVPLSGAAGGDFRGDLHILDLVAEVKARKYGDGFKRLELWLGDHDVLFLRRDRRRPLVLMEWETYTQMITAYARGRERNDDLQPE